MWANPPPIDPRLLFVYESTSPAGYVQSCRSTEWLLDCSLTPFGACRVGPVRSAWRERREGELHLYPPGTRYWEDTSTCGVSHTRGVFIAFTRGDLTPLEAIVRHRSCGRFMDPRHRVTRLMERLADIALGQGEAGFWDAQAVFYDIVARLSRARRTAPGLFEIEADAPAPGDSGFVGRVHAFLQDHVAERVTREDIARHLNLSLSAFAHRYRREAGESPMHALTRLRLQLAKSLLLKGERLKNIAAQTGFCDQYHLSKTFKRWEGVSPRKWC